MYIYTQILQNGNSKPQGKHLQTRTEYLLKLLKNSEKNETVVIAPRPKKPKFKKKKELKDSADTTKAEGDVKIQKASKLYGAPKVKKSKKLKLDIPSDDSKNADTEISKGKVKGKKKLIKPKIANKVGQEFKESKDEKKIKKKKGTIVDEAGGDGKMKSLNRNEKLNDSKTVSKKKVNCFFVLIYAKNSMLILAY